MAVKLFKLSNGWSEKYINLETDHRVGAYVIKLFKKLDQAVEILRILQQEAEDYDADSIDIYFDDSYSTVVLTVKLFDEENEQLREFNIEHTIGYMEFCILLQFLEFQLHHNINIYYYRGRASERLTKECEDCYEVGDYVGKETGYVR